MAISDNVNDRQKDSFGETSSGKTARRIIAEDPIPVSGTLTVGSATTPTMTNLSLPTPDTEVSHVLQTDLKQLLFKTRDRKSLKYAFVSGESGTKYMTVPPSGIVVLDGLSFSGKTLYLQSPSVTTVEILELT